MTALERAARAMFVGGVEHISDGDGWDDLPELFKNMMAKKVRAVLMAVRSAPDNVLDAGCAVGPDTNQGEFCYLDAHTVFTAMIDAILNEPQEREVFGMKFCARPDMDSGSMAMVVGGNIVGGVKNIQPQEQTND